MQMRESANGGDFWYSSLSTLGYRDDARIKFTLSEFGKQVYLEECKRTLQEMNTSALEVERILFQEERDIDGVHDFTYEGLKTTFGDFSMNEICDAVISIIR